MSRKRKQQPKFQEATGLDGVKIITLDPVGTPENPYSSRIQDQPWYIHIEAVAAEAIRVYYEEHNE